MAPLKMHLALAVLFAWCSSCLVVAQSGPCPTSHSTESTASPTLSGDLICIVPQVYGPGGLVGTNNQGPMLPTNSNVFHHEVHFQQASRASLTPLATEIGTQLNQLPFASPASGFVFSFDPARGVVSQTTESFGPILTERADTIGRHKLFVGVSYQYFNFDKVGKTNLRSFGAVYQHEDESCEKAGPGVFPCLGDDTPLPTKDFIYTSNRIDLKVHEITAVATFGLTNRIDISVAVPILNVKMAMSSDARIKDFEGSDPATYSPTCPPCVHQFASPAAVPGETVFAPDPTYGNNHATFARSSSGKGIGDVVLRGKIEVIKTEKAGVAVGLDLRLPTGDAYNFRGAGTYGTRPFVAFSYNGHVSPHASLGYQVNGSSVLAGDITDSTKAKAMPNVLTFSVGADASLNRRVSATVDYLTQTLYGVQSVNPSQFTDYCEQGGCPGVTPCSCTFSNISSTPSYHITQQSLATGAKFNPFGKLLVTANVLFRLNDAGLHSKPAPLLGLSYTF